MKLVVQVQLLLSPMQASAVEATLRTCNRAATYVSEVAFARGLKDRHGLQKAVYAEVKASFGLSAQPTVRVVKKVVDAYAALKASRRAVVGPVVFRSSAAQPFDDRCLSWQFDIRTVSIWTVAGRMKGIRFRCSAAQLAMLTRYRAGESDLVRRDGTWFLVATCDVPEPEAFEPVDWIGVDRGIVNLAATSDGVNYQGRRLSRYRRWQDRKRAELQSRQTRSATRRLARRGKRERRHATHVNHRISKEIVSGSRAWGHPRPKAGGAPVAGSLSSSSAGFVTGYGFAATSGAPSPRGRSTNSGGTSPTRPAGQGCRSWRWTRPIRRSAVRAAVTPVGPTGPTGIVSAVVGAGSLARPTSSPGSMCAIAHARRGCSSPHPHPHPDICRMGVDATCDRPVVGGSRERDEV